MIIANAKVITVKEPTAPSQIKTDSSEPCAALVAVILVSWPSLY